VSTRLTQEKRLDDAALHYRERAAYGPYNPPKQRKQVHELGTRQLQNEEQPSISGAGIREGHTWSGDLDNDGGHGIRVDDIGDGDGDEEVEEAVDLVTEFLKDPT
jgi:hypothetical protein